MSESGWYVNYSKQGGKGHPWVKIIRACKLTSSASFPVNVTADDLGALWFTEFSYMESKLRNIQ